MFDRVEQSTFDRSLLELREKQVAEEMHAIMSVTTHYMAIPLFLAFWIADLLYAPQYKWEFLGLRLLIIPLSLTVKKLVLNSQNFNRLQITVSAYAFSLALLINLMIFRVDQPGSIYYAGLNLVSVGCLSFIPYTTVYYIATAVSIYLPYYAYVLIKVRQTEDIKTILINSFFVVATLVICYVIRFFQERIRASELRSKVELQNEITSRNKIIEQKTEEATKLNQLSSQFSPQVVKAIRDGKINLDEGVHRSPICAVFIDIVRSTEKVTTLQEDKVQLVLARFLDSVLTIFLKYDLTIDKFQGDGVLAFANDPVRREDYIQRTCLAALEAKQAIESDQEFYKEHWQSKMQVRVGIADGFANVGFYGGKKYFRSFTAIGVPLPYASRLTSLAEPDQILVNYEIGRILESQNYVLKNLGVKTLKGFESDSKPVFQLLDGPQSSLGLKESKTCPTHVNSVLYLDTNENGLFVFKCRECDFQDINQETGVVPTLKAS